MKLTRRVCTWLAAASVAATGIIAPTAGADTFHETYPETPALNPDLPIVHTTHGSDHIKANVLNPRPVCNSGEDYRTVVYKVTDDFSPAGTISATNKSKNTIPLTQNLSKSQTVSLSIKGDRTDQTSINLGGSHSQDGSEGSIGIAKTITEQIGGEFSYSLSWEAGQQIGPYDVPAGHTGEATYGFRTINLDGTQQYCRPNGTWSTPTPWRVFAPMKNEVEVKLYKNASDSWMGTADEADKDKTADESTQTEGVDESTQTEGVTDEVAEADADAVATDGNTEVDPEVDTSVADPEVEEGTDAEPEIEPETATDPEGDLPADGETVLDENAAENEATDEEAAENEATDEETTEDATDEAAAEDATDEEASEDEAAENEAKADYDLEPYFTVAAGKSAGFAGLVALRVKNVGDKRYFQDNMATRFRIDVHTAEGPEGVDRLITPGWFNGAYTRDLGFDAEKGVRSFEVTLSNPINSGDTALLANLNFGDGQTKEGRLKNYITVTQTGRIDGDETTSNDQDVDSREHTFDHMGRKNKGIF